MIVIRLPETIYHARGAIDNGTFAGRWHFSFDQYSDPEHVLFGALRVFNDDTLSPGAVWPLHPHRGIEVVTYCARGEFRHADEHGKGGILQKGWVQHTSVGRGMYHSEINNHPDEPMRFIQMWFLPDAPDLTPAVQQKAVEQRERTNKFLPLFAAAQVFSCYLEAGRNIEYPLEERSGAYLYVLEGGPVLLNGQNLPALGAAQVTGPEDLRVEAREAAELLLVEVTL